jgi:hypothetical protein
MTIATAAIGDDAVRAVLVFAARNITSQRRRAAALDCRHHFQLFEADMAAIGDTPRGAVVAENVRYLQHRPGHAICLYGLGQFAFLLCRFGAFCFLHAGDVLVVRDQTSIAHPADRAFDSRNPG